MSSTRAKLKSSSEEKGFKNKVRASVLNEKQAASTVLLLTNRKPFRSAREKAQTDFKDGH